MLRPRVVWTIVLVGTLPVVVLAGGGGDDLGDGEVASGMALQAAAVVAVAVVYLQVIGTRLGVHLAGAGATAARAAGYAVSVFADDDQTGDAALLGVMGALALIGLTWLLERQRAGREDRGT